MTTTVTPMVKAERVHKRYGRVEALRGIDVEVGRGEVMCLVGPAGAGKSTFLRCINHLERIQAGRLWVDGELVGYRERDDTLHEMRDKEVALQRMEIGMVFAGLNLFPHMTALQNVMEAPVRVKREPREEVRERAQKLLIRVGLGDRAHTYPGQMSGSQPHRVAIARALCMQPKLMLFDEPTAGLDPEPAAEVLEIIGQLAQAGMTMIVVTDTLQFAREVGDRLVVMAEGVVLESGSPRQVLTDPQDERARAFLAAVQ